MVLLLLALVTVMVLSLAQDWRIEMLLARNLVRSRQAALLAESGVYYAMGKLLATQIAERQSPQEALEQNADLWRGDGSRRELKVAGGTVLVRITDESGKINLNQAPEPLLYRFFEVMGIDEAQARPLVEALMDWRDEDAILRPQGAEGEYYAGLAPAYTAKNGPLDAVEELFWIKGFDPGRYLRLREFFTVQRTGRGVNVNAAPLEVLRALGFSGEQAQSILQARQVKPIRNRRELDSLYLGGSGVRFSAPVVFRASQVFEIVSTGVVEYPSRGGRHTIKAIVRIVLNRPIPWEILWWTDDYLG
jgi:general secretion pathway protein K